MRFVINDTPWETRFVDSGSRFLTRSDGSITIGMTDGNTNTVYLDKHLNGRMLDKVLAHELCHCVMFSYNIYMNIEQEEFLADWFSNYGRDTVYLLDNLMRQLKNSRAGA